MASSVAICPSKRSRAAVKKPSWAKLVANDLTRSINPLPPWINRRVGAGKVVGAATTPDTVRPLGVLRLTVSRLVSANAALLSAIRRAAMGKPAIPVNTTRREIVDMEMSRSLSLILYYPLLCTSAQSMCILGAPRRPAARRAQPVALHPRQRGAPDVAVGDHSGHRGA